MITVSQIRAARAMLGLKQQELADAAGLSTGTLNNIERGVQTDPKVSTLRAIQFALEKRGIEFIHTDSGCVGVQLRPQTLVDGATNILIIDDSSSDRKLFSAWLKKQSDAKYAITEAANASEGYELFTKIQPSCIILDFMMYGINGFQMLVNMKKEHAIIPPIIFVTAGHNETLEKEVRGLGVHTYLDKKTLTAERLNQAVANALASFHQE